MEEELLNLLDIVFDLYENGCNCYEDPENYGGYLGKAVNLDDTTFNRIADILNTRRSSRSYDSED